MLHDFDTGDRVINSHIIVFATIYVFSLIVLIGCSSGHDNALPISNDSSAFLSSEEQIRASILDDQNSVSNILLDSTFNVLDIPGKALIGTIELGSAYHWMLVSGYDCYACEMAVDNCQTCDQDACSGCEGRDQVIFMVPSFSLEAYDYQQYIYSYPGTIHDLANGDMVVSEQRAYYGSCLTADGKEFVLISRSVKDYIEFVLPDQPTLYLSSFDTAGVTHTEISPEAIDTMSILNDNYTINTSPTCIEIQGINQTTSP